MSAAHNLRGGLTYTRKSYCFMSDIGAATSNLRHGVTQPERSMYENSALLDAPLLDSWGLGQEKDVELRGCA
ncbi:hypothetical protein SPHINGO8AM_190129 [Sphingomonas sp. 8AM]|nr:hypothetical protein SPHINGO8AM_190129 [Sphingomonas sp. 8AM]